MFNVILSPKAEKSLDNISKSNRRLFNHVIGVLEQIAQDPYCAKSLVANLKGYYSYRVSNYRIIFEIDKDKSKIYVEKIAHRSNVYK